MFQLDIKVNQSQDTSIGNHVLLVPVMSELLLTFINHSATLVLGNIEAHKTDLHGCALRGF